MVVLLTTFMVRAAALSVLRRSVPAYPTSPPVENGARQEQALLKHRASPMAYSLIPLIVAPRSKYSARALALSLRPVSNPVCPIQVLCEGLMSLL
jgi:hypothetical protein